MRKYSIHVCERLGNDYDMSRLLYVVDGEILKMSIKDFCETYIDSPHSVDGKLIVDNDGTCECDNEEQAERVALEWKWMAYSDSPGIPYFDNLESAEEFIKEEKEVK